MSFGFPLGLWALGALLPLTAAYFLRRKQKPRKVSALFLWRTPNQRALAGPRLERFTREISFLLEALAIVAAALFLADVRLGRDAQPKHLVVVLDGSLSMSARGPRGPLVEAVRRELAKVTQREGARVLTVVESGAHPKIIAGPQAPVAQALSSLESWRPMGATHEVMPALLLARELGGAHQRAYLFTDGPLPQGLTVPPEVQVVMLGEPLENLALLSAQRRDEGDLALLTLRVGNFASSARTVTVGFSGPARDSTRPGGAARSQKLEVDAGRTAVLRLSFSNAGPIEVALPDDALPEDGRVTLLPSPIEQVPVQLLDGLGAAEASAVRRFLEVAPGVLRSVPLGQEARALTIGPPGTPARVRMGASGPLRTFVGPFFAQKGHPLLDDVNFGGVMWTAGVNPPGLPLVSAGEAVLVSEAEGGTLHLNLDLARSNVQRTAAWPILMGNILRLARLDRPGLPKRHLMLGEEVPVVTEPGVRYVLAGPSGERPILGAGPVRLPPLAEPGRYRLLREGQEVDALQLLALDPRESDLRTRQSKVIAASAGEGLRARALDRPRSLWPLLVLIALLLLDFWVTARPPTGSRPAEVRP